MKRIYTFIFTLILLSGLLSSCSSTSHKLICPLPSGLDVNNLGDCTVPAKFTTEDFGWMGGNLNFEVFSEDLYDVVDINTMEIGDTLLYQGQKMIIESIVEENGIIDINGGVEEGGAWLTGAGGGTYRSITFDDHSLYTSLGKAHVGLSEDFRIVDCGVEPTTPSDTISTGQKLYLENLEEWRQSFYPINTRICIENGLITEIKRVWIP